MCRLRWPGGGNRILAVPIEAIDPVFIGAAVAPLAAIGFLAAVVPRDGPKLDPIAALRSD